MTTPKPKKLEFTDCRGCGKRVATTATLCGHCHTPHPQVQGVTSIVRSPKDDGDLEDEKEGDDSHMALSSGGYEEDDDTNETANSPTSKGLWWYVAWALLFVFVLSAVFPWL